MPKPINDCSILLPMPTPRKASDRALRVRKKERLGPRGSFSTSSKPRLAYLVSITSRAERDLAHLYGEIKAEHSEAAWKWYLGLKEAILSLEVQPNRCPVTRRRDKLRHLLYGHSPHSHRGLKCSTSGTAHDGS